MINGLEGENAVETLFSKDFHLLQALNAADLGCAAGPTTFTVISIIKRMMEKKCRELNCQTLELQVYLNDLPRNDFNTLFKGLSSKGLIDEDKLDTFNVPSYFPSPEEVKDIVERDGSFTIDHMEGFELDSPQMQDNDKWVRGEKFAKVARAFTKPIISN
ncbi:hypothetical protein TEA_025017 [Camellia sinensis var. sinensis]|uniref:Uncharacterized protein n=1 Tax=Camellia sinensis var. sinensis TaxID=542762 RepID=A0A4S4ER18_CAMSN|nr:hypothetical protein TEA_025017 [Camellia sinensis var. sinensis]